VPVTFNVWLVKANSIGNSSALNIGANLLMGFGSNNKETNGNGELNGDAGAMPTLLCTTDDRDWFDMPWVMGGPSSVGSAGQPFCALPSGAAASPVCPPPGMMPGPPGALLWPPGPGFAPAPSPPIPLWPPTPAPPLGPLGA
jgi:hypothetical protein